MTPSPHPHPHHHNHTHYYTHPLKESTINFSQKKKDREKSNAFTCRLQNKQSPSLLKLAID